MKNTTFFLAICFSLYSLYTRAQNVSYKVLENDPYRSNLYIAPIPFYVDVATKDANLSLGYGVKVSFVLKKLLTFNFYMERPYTGGTDWGYHFATHSAFSMPTVNVPQKFRHLEFGGTYHLRDRTKDTYRKVVLHSSSGGGYTYSKYLMVPATVRKVLGLRAGLYSFHTVISANHNGTVIGDIGEPGVISSDGTRFGGAANLNNYPQGPADPNYNTESITNLRVVGAYFGISTTAYYRIIINADDYGRRGSEVYSNWYADFILAPPKIDPFEGANGVTYELSGGLAEGFATRSIGARGGYELNYVSRRVGYYLKIEAGLKPGLSNSKFYTVLAWGIAFNSRIKALAASAD